MTHCWTRFACIAATTLFGSALGNTPASATPGSGITVSNIVNGRFGELQINTAGDKTDRWGMILKTLAATDVGADRVILAPRGDGGWHAHPAPNMLIVTRGTVAWADSLLCTPRMLHAGDTLIETAYRAHNAWNPGDEEAEIIAIRIKPTSVIGPAFRIDEPKPNNCN